MSDQTSPQDVTPEVTPAGSPFQSELLNSGAQAQNIDVTALLDQLNALQAQVDKLNAEKGIPADPVAASKDDLLAHLEARAAQYPNEDFKPLIQAVKSLPDSDAITVAHSGKVHELISEFVESLPRHELGYVKALSRVFHMGILDRTIAAAV